MNNEELYNSEDKLRKLAGTAEGTMKTPDGYFNKLNADIMQKTAGLPKENKEAFQVTEHYFEDLPLKIADRIAAGKSSSPLFTLKRVLAPLAIAALLAIGFFFGPDVSTKNTDAEEIITAQELHEAGILMEMDEEALVEQLAGQNDFNMSATDSLTQYLLDNNIEQSQLENQL